MEIEDCIYFLTTHLFEDIKRDSFFVISAHNEFHGAVSDTVVVATVIVGNVLETHNDDATAGRAVLLWK